MSINSKLVIDESQCISCGICIGTCPAKIFTMQNKQVIIDKQKAVYCINCGDCISVCPKGIIKKDDELTEDLYQDNEGLRSKQISAYVRC